MRGRPVSTCRGRPRRGTTGPLHGPEERKRRWSGAYPGRTSSIARESGSHLSSGSHLTRFHALCRSRYARVPFEFACCLLFSVPKASQPRFCVACSLAAACPGGFVRRRCTRSRWPTSRSACRWPRLARPLGRPSRVFPQLRADGFEAAGTLSDRHHVYDVMFTAYLAPRGCGDWDTPFAYPQRGSSHESQA